MWPRRLSVEALRKAVKQKRDDADELRRAKREWRRKHPIEWMLNRLCVLMLLAGLFVAGFLSAGMLETDESGLHVVRGGMTEDGDWMLVVDRADDDFGWATHQASRVYLECRYLRLGRGIVRRYWIGEEIGTGHRLGVELPRSVEQEFRNELLAYFDAGPASYDPAAYEAAMAKPTAKSHQGCPVFIGSDLP